MFLNLIKAIFSSPKSFEPYVNLTTQMAKVSRAAGKTLPFSAYTTGTKLLHVAEKIGEVAKK